MITRPLRSALIAASVLALGTLGIVIALRVTFPGVLEWQEGGMLAHVERVRAGQALYPEPSPDFIAFPYPPLFVWVASLLGESLLTLRALSILATIAVLGLLYVSVRRASDCTVAGLVAAGIFAASYSFSGAWFDVGRVDMLAIALALGSLHLARFKEGAGALAAAGALCGLAFLTKQTAVLLSAPIVLGLFAQNRRGAAIFAGVAAATGAGTLLFLHLASGGGSTWTMFDLLAGHEWFEPWSVWYRDLPWLLPALLLFPLTRFPIAPAIGMLAATWLGRAHTGGAENTLLPAALLAALLIGEAFGNKEQWSRVGAIALLQFALLAYNPKPFLPTDEDRAAHTALVERTEGLKLFAPYQPELSSEPCAHAQAIIDLLSSDAAQEEAQAFTAELERRLNEGHYDGVLLAEPWPDLTAIERNYPRRENLQGPVPRTGHRHDAVRLLYTR